ncbi:MAG: hypothetical protein FJX80_15100 [Bacteroidetes bacterium]|nr:hypothetical protein [Bacteroidota bacterium]
MEQLQRLNQFRLDANRNYDELQQIRERHMRSLNRVDSKLDDYHNIISAIRAEILTLIVNENSALNVEVLNIFNFRDEQVLMAKICIIGFPTIYKAFSPLDYNLYQVSKTDLMNDFVVQGRVKELVIEWLQKHEDWTGLFEQQFSKAEAVMERFVDDEAVFHFFKRRPIML